MNAASSFARPSSFSITVAATLATIVALGLLSAVATLFERDGRPLQSLAAAERACTQHAYVSEREACMREWLAGAQRSRIASK